MSPGSKYGFMVLRGSYYCVPNYCLSEQEFPTWRLMVLRDSLIIFSSNHCLPEPNIGVRRFMDLRDNIVVFTSDYCLSEPYFPVVVSTCHIFRQYNWLPLRTIDLPSQYLVLRDNNAPSKTTLSLTTVKLSTSGILFWETITSVLQEIVLRDCNPWEVMCQMYRAHDMFNWLSTETMFRFHVVFFSRSSLQAYAGIRAAYAYCLHKYSYAT